MCIRDSTYPVLQTADIILYRAHAVPVGQDQLPHLELTREVVRRFHHLYQATVFPEPEAILSPTPKFMGMDGRKMSKSYNNVLGLGDPAADIRKKVMAAPTDPQRVQRTDKGNPDVCNIYSWHKALSPLAVIQEVDQGCRTAGIGCVDCKKKLLVNMDAVMDPIREKRAQLMTDTGALDDILHHGNTTARHAARETMSRVRDALKL